MKKNPRRLILKSLSYFEKEKFIPKIDESLLSDKDRRLYKEVLRGIIRNLSFLDYIISKHVQKMPSKDLKNVLRIGLYQLLFLDKVPHYAAINETLNLLKNKSERGFINAVLRNISKKSISDFLKDPKTPEELSVYLSHPLWLLKKWIKLFGFEKTKEICEVNNSKAPISIRVNTLEKGGEVTQDASSQAVVPVLDPQPEETILDACAHPGVKTSHIAALMENKGKIIALDQKKSTLFDENISRLGVEIAEYKQVDLSEPLNLKEKVDRILLDAPCSCWGIIRRHPEIRWRQKEREVETLVQLQKKIRDHLLPHLKEDGVFVYSVCTFSKEETLDFVEDTLQKHPNLKLETSEQVLPTKNGPDGFFTARFKST